MIVNRIYNFIVYIEVVYLVRVLSMCKVLRKFWEGFGGCACLIFSDFFFILVIFEIKVEGCF